MTRSRRLLLGGSLAALASTGCILTSAQVLVKFGLTNPLVVNNPNAVTGVFVDLTTVSEYEDHKDKLHDLVDLAILGEVANNGSGEIQIELWMTTGDTRATVTTETQIKAPGVATRVWGPFKLAGNATRRIGWNESAALFGAGKKPMLNEVKGDGRFTLYLIGTTGTYNFTVRDGYLILVVDAGI